MPLKSMLAKWAMRKAIGVYVGEQEIVVSQLASTPFGPVEIARCSESYAPDKIEEILKRLLAPLTGRRKRFPIPVAVGLSGPRVFFTTRPIKSSNAESSPQMLLHEVLQSASISVDDMVLDVVKAQPHKRLLASIVSCRKKYLSGLLTAFAGAGVNPNRVEPAACSLLRTAAFRSRAPRRAKTVLRLFLGSEQGLAVLAIANQPFVWRNFTLPPGGEATAILSATRTLQMLSKPCGIDVAADAVLLHGRIDLRSTLDLGSLKDEIGIPVIWHDTASLEGPNFAFGLALGCLGQGPESFDLARSLRPRRSLWELFPWAEMAVQAALLVCMALFLTDRSANAEHSYRAMRIKIAQHAWMESVTESELEKEKKDLQQKVEAIRRFLASRILWTSYSHDIPTRLPPNATMNGFEGICDLEVSGKKKDTGLKTKKSFLIHIAAPVAKDGSMPKDIDHFLGSLREHPLLKKDFPIVELVDLKWHQPFQGAKPIAYCSVICLPKIAPASPPPAAAEPKH